MNRTDEQTRGNSSEPVSSRANVETNSLLCPACGAAVRRRSARFCATCGRGLKDNFYAPADSLLASYHLQHARPAAMWCGQEMAHGSVKSEPAKRTLMMLASLPRLKMLFAPEGNTASAIALIMTCSALVPFVGILFCPLAVLVGGYGLFEARFVPGTTGGARLAVCCIIFGFLIAGVQVLLFTKFP